MTDTPDGITIEKGPGKGVFSVIHKGELWATVWSESHGRRGTTYRFQHPLGGLVFEEKEFNGKPIRSVATAFDKAQIAPIAARVLAKGKLEPLSVHQARRDQRDAERAEKHSDESARRRIRDAAPDLLAALEEIASGCIARQPGHVDYGKNRTKTEIYQIAESAIAKATKP